MTKLNSALGLIALAFASGSVLAAETAQVDFTGSIMADSCVVAVTTQSVDLGLISKSSIATAGQTSPKTAFNIQLNSCDEGQSVKLKLDATAVGGETDIIQTTGTATGVGVGVWEAGNPARVAIAGETDTQIADATGLLTYNFEAAYVSLGGVNQGTANATAMFEVVYP